MIKIRIYPTKEQRETISKWLGVQRWIYNRCLYLINEKKAKATQKDLRDKVVNDKNFLKENTWMLDYEYDLRDEAMRDFLHNLKTNFAKGGKFNLEFRTKKKYKKQVSMSVLAKKWNRPKNFYSSIFKPKNLKSSEPLHEKLDYTCRLIKTMEQHYYLAIPKPLDIRSENQAPDNSMIFMDPGVKNFITAYDPSGKAFVYGKRDIGRIARLLHYKRKLQSKIDKKKLDSKALKIKPKIYKMRLALGRLGTKINNLVDELHKKLSKWLCENYKRIYLPKLNFHNFKKLNKKSKAKMASLRHCSFFERLKNKSREYPGCVVQEVKEDFTSKTCSNCGSIKWDLKNADIYDCRVCNVSMDRDVNACKNIMLKYFSNSILSC